MIQRWQLQALCLNYDPSVFSPRNLNSIRKAKRICAECPVSAECLEFAMTNEFGVDSPEGRSSIYGGLTGRERHDLAVERREGVSAAC